MRISLEPDDNPAIRQAADMLRAAREQRGISLHEAARHCGCNDRGIKALEKSAGFGSYLTLARAYKLIDLYQLADLERTKVVGALQQRENELDYARHRALARLEHLGDDSAALELCLLLHKSRRSSLLNFSPIEDHTGLTRTWISDIEVGRYFNDHWDTYRTRQLIELYQPPAIWRDRALRRIDQIDDRIAARRRRDLIRRISSDNKPNEVEINLMVLLRRMRIHNGLTQKDLEKHLHSLVPIKALENLEYSLNADSFAVVNKILQICNPPERLITQARACLLGVIINFLIAGIFIGESPEPGTRAYRTLARLGQSLTMHGTLHTTTVAYMVTELAFPRKQYDQAIRRLRDYHAGAQKWPTLGEYLRSLRTSNAKTLLEVSKATGVSTHTINNVELGNRSSLIQYIVSMLYVLGIEDPLEILALIALTHPLTATRMRNRRGEITSFSYEEIEPEKYLLAGKQHGMRIFSRFNHRIRPEAGETLDKTAVLPGELELCQLASAIREDARINLEKLAKNMLVEPGVLKSFEDGDFLALNSNQCISLFKKIPMSAFEVSLVKTAFPRLLRLSRGPELLGDLQADTEGVDMINWHQIGYWLESYLTRNRISIINLANSISRPPEIISNIINGHGYLYLPTIREINTRIARNDVTRRKVIRLIADQQLAYWVGHDDESAIIAGYSMRTGSMSLSFGASRTVIADPWLPPEVISPENAAKNSIYLADHLSGFPRYPEHAAAFVRVRQAVFTDRMTSRRVFGQRVIYLPPSSLGSTPFEIRRNVDQLHRLMASGTVVRFLSEEVQRHVKQSFRAQFLRGPGNEKPIVVDTFFRECGWRSPDPKIFRQPIDYLNYLYRNSFDISQSKDYLQKLLAGSERGIAGYSRRMERPQLILGTNQRPKP